MPPTQGFQNYGGDAPLTPQDVAPQLGPPTPAPDEMMGGEGNPDHSPESTGHALRHAVDLAFKTANRPKNIPGKGSLRQLRQLGMPESEITLGRASGLLEGDD